MPNFLKKLSPKRVVAAIARRRIASALVAVLIAAAAYYEVEVPEPVVEALKTIFDALLQLVGWGS